MEEEEGITFEKFDIVSEDASDHHYFSQNSKSQDRFTNAATAVHKKIMQEWRTLQQHLPDSIFVRGYENRIDLLRAVIVGAAGTPYQDGLYFFDISFPSDYPNSPPSVWYHSFGMRINPNLYASGTVCLSLLNTWPGKKCEKWNRKESNVLQILLSIQALVLNAEPYYNEPAFGKIGSRPKKSNDYNAGVLVLSFKTMLFLLDRPPKNFTSLVETHFRERAFAIVSACNAYVDGSYSKEIKVDLSEEYKDVIDQYYTKLVKAFTKNGTPVSVFPERVIRKKREAVIKKKSWIVKAITCTW